MSRSERDVGSDGWATFITNKVVLHPNMLIVDLHCIVSGQDEAILRRLAREYLKKSETIILLCMAASGSDPSINRVDVQVVRECDPDGARNVGIVTKADRIDDSHQSAFGGHVAGRNVACASFVLKHGWHRVRLRTDAEYKAKVSTPALLARQAEMFDQPDWRKLAERKGGVWEAGDGEVHCRRIQQGSARNVDVLRSKLAKQYGAAQAALATLPAEIVNPVGAVYGLLKTLGASLHTVIHQSRAYTSQLACLQDKFCADVFQTVARFMPCSKAHADKVASWRSTTAYPGWRAGVPFTKKVWHDDLVDSVRQNTSARTDMASIAQTRMSFMGPIIDSWTQLMRAIVEGVCGDKPGAKTQVLALLVEEIEAYRTRCVDSARARCGLQKCEDIIDIERISLADREAYKAAKKSLFDAYKTVYPSAQRDFVPFDPTLPGSSTRPPAKSTTSAPKASTTPLMVTPPAREPTGTPHGPTPADRDMIFELAALVGLYLTKGVGRRVDVVSFDTQSQHAITQSVAAVEDRLRDGLGLEYVLAHVRKCARALCEPDNYVVIERKRLGAKCATLARLRAAVDGRWRGCRARPSVREG
ncbi:hypothetical protein Q5752_002576 [Cryptotrichosporon argae]